MRARGMGANVVCTEIKPTAALKATLEGFRVMPMDEAAKIGDIFITATGMKDIIVGRHFDSMKDGALVCNTGHYDCEINLGDLEARAKGKREIRKDNEEYVMKDGRRVYVLGQGRLINLAAAEGHPSEVMDMSFANQFQGMLKLAREGKTLEKKVYELPPELDQEIAATKLATMGLQIDALSAEQAAYANDYSAGT
jgi:adenosylhomocysteinase